MKHLQLANIVSATLLCSLSGMAVADLTLSRNANRELNFYGFAKLDATYQTDETNSIVAPRFATGSDDGAMNLTAMHSRFGFKWTGPTLENGYRAGAVLEFDLFDASSSNQMKFRDRLAAFTLRRDSSTWLFGQHWDVFSPLNPTTLMTNGNLWNTGNLGFRRAQVRYSGTAGKQGIDWAASVNDPSTGGTPAPNTESPILEGRLGLRVRQASVGISAALGDDESSGDKESIAGLSVDWIVPFGNDLTIKGEAGMGENLAVFLSRSGVDQNVLAVWVELVQTAAGSNDWWVGLGLENVDDVSTGAEDTQLLFGGYQWKLAGAGGGSPVRLGVEAARFDTDLVGGGDESGIQVIFSTQYTF
ncbi:MAG: hypothetical protein OEN20_08640 [Gammaproteobacteria bacterium]|nr:hypothetical protein [Gammaproteobacteria bacterium]